MEKCIVGNARFWIDNVIYISCSFFFAFVPNSVLDYATNVWHKDYMNRCYCCRCLCTRAPKISAKILQYHLLFDNSGGSKSNNTGVRFALFFLYVCVRLLTYHNRIKCNIILILLSKFQPQHVKRDTPSVPNNEHTIQRNVIFSLLFSCPVLFTCVFNKIKFIVGYSMDFSICWAYIFIDWHSTSLSPFQICRMSGVCLC